MADFDSYATKAKPADDDTVLALDTEATISDTNSRHPLKQVKLSGVLDWLVDRLADKVMSKLDTSNKTIIGAINELNSNIFSYKVISSGSLKDISVLSHITFLTITSDVSDTPFQSYYLGLMVRQSINSTSDGIIFLISLGDTKKFCATSISGNGTFSNWITF